MCVGNMIIKKKIEKKVGTMVQLIKLLQLNKCNVHCESKM